MSQALLWENITLSVDLLNCTSAYRTFLQKCGACALLQDENWLHRAVYRYEVFWLPLLSIWNNTGDLQPPLDVHWVWHAHMLHSADYADYCRSRFGKVLRHKIRVSSNEEESAVARTRVVWRNEYPSEMYDMDMSTTHSPRALGGGTQLHALATAAQKELLFRYQVALPHYNDSIFLKNALARYKQLLLLRMLKPGAYIGTLPCDMLLMQRMHMMHPVEYLHDREHFSLWAAGDTVPPASYRASPDEYAFMAPDAADSDTWRRVFHEPLFVNGSTYRGKSKHHYIHPLFADFVRREVIDCCELTFDDLKVTDVWSGDKNIVVDARRVGHTSFTFHSVFHVKGKVGMVMSGTNDMGLGSIPFDCKHHRGIELQVHSRSGVGCVSSERHIVTSVFAPRQALAANGGSFRPQTTIISVPRVSYTDPTMTFKCTVKTAEREPYVFSFDRDQFVQGRFPADAQHFLTSWLPWPLSTSSDIEFSLARHSLKHRERLIAFGIQMVKLEEMDMMAIFVFQNNERLVSVAHSIGAEHLPLSEHVSNMCPVSFDAEAGDHAMLIKNHKSDWCVCVGRWEPSKSPEEGRVQIRICRLDTFAVQTFSIQDGELRTISFDGVTIDMPSGRISVTASCESLGEHVALAFAVGVIFVACQRTAAGNDGSSWATSSFANGSVRSCKSVESLESLSSKASSNHGKHSVSRFSAKRRLNERKRSRRRKISASFTFLLACGLRIDRAIGVSGHSSLSRRPSNVSACDLAAAMAVNGNGNGYYGDGSHVDIQL